MANVPDGLLLSQELLRLVAEAEEAVDQMALAGVALANAERDYRRALRVEITRERMTTRTPVRIISDVCRGDDNVSNLKALRDAAEAKYEASKELVNVKKLAVRILGEQINREYGRPSNMR